MAREWIENLKVGDKVIYQDRFKESIETVEAVNKATIKVRGCLFNKNNGRLRGGDTWCVTRINEPTDIEVNRIKEANARLMLKNRINKINTLIFTKEQVDIFNKFLDEFNQ